MNCKKVQEFILTDYIDGEMDERGHAAVEAHLAGCLGCAEFYNAAQKVGNGLFVGASRAEAPEYLWRRVREAILAEDRAKKTHSEVVLERLKSIFYIPKPVLAIITVVVLLLVAGAATKITINHQAAVNADMFDYLSETVGYNAANDNSGFGTSIEQYFM